VSSRRFRRNRANNFEKESVLDLDGACSGTNPTP
jgi:hypothetical protein